MDAGNRDRGDLVFIGDVHLEAVDGDLEAFLALLDSLSSNTATLVFAGDLFNLWIGRRDCERPWHRAVLERFAALRSQGTVLRYVVGNRDYRIAEAYGGTWLDDAPEEGLVERKGGKSLFAIHGDLSNVRDRQYRTWRKISRSWPFWTLFNLLPTRARIRLADGIERRMRASNLRYKAAFPEDQVREYAARYLGEGHDAVVLGHFHVEKDLEAAPPSPPGRILVLPEWKASRRHLRVSPEGEIEFVDSSP